MSQARAKASSKKWPRGLSRNTVNKLKQTVWFLLAAGKCALGKGPKVSPDAQLAQMLSLQFLHSGAAGGTWQTMTWKGHNILKAPTDLWMYCEIIDLLQPKTIIETGTWEGGGAVFLRDMCRVRDLPTKVITIDTEPRKTPECEGVEYIRASSVDKSVLQKLSEVEHPLLVILDSDHSYGHVYAELVEYSKFVRPGEFIIVEDTIDLDDGPRRAVNEFLRDVGGLEVCEHYERLGLTFNRGGYLRKK